MTRKRGDCRFHAQKHHEITYTHTSGVAAPEQLSLFAEEALDIADYLREESDPVAHVPTKQSVSTLTIGAIGVVYGDIGTSPIYAFREALRPVAGEAFHPPMFLAFCRS